MNTRGLVSVIIPTYNRAAIVSRAIDNIFCQTYKQFEVIVVDDGSTDGTTEVLRRYGNRIRTIKQVNRGPACARNRGVEIAHGEFIAFQDSDDLWDPSKLERQVSLLERFGPSVPVSLCSALFRMINGRPYTSFDIARIHPPLAEGLWTNVADVLVSRFVLFNQTSVIRRSSLERVGVFDELLPYLEDYDLPLRLAMEGPWALINDPLVIYQENSPNSLAAKARRESLVLKKCEIAILEKTSRSAQQKGAHAIYRLAQSRVRSLRRLVFYERLSSSAALSARVAGSALTTFERYREKASSRTPWYPRPSMIPFPGATRA